MHRPTVVHRFKGTEVSVRFCMSLEMSSMFKHLRFKQTREAQTWKNCQCPGSFLVEDVEDAHPQPEHYLPQHEDEII
jgi:hypothetical protein